MNDDGWIPVTERLPESLKWVLACTDCADAPTVLLMWVSTEDRFGKPARWDDGRGDGYQDYRVTHWRPLPPAPIKA